MLRLGEEYLAEREVADASVDAWLLLEYVTGLSRAQYLARAAEPPEHVCGTLRPTEDSGLRERKCSEDEEKTGMKPGSSKDVVQRYLELLERRGAHIPLQHLTGEQEFMGLPFLVNEHVLIPRQDTETLVEEALGRLRPGMRVLDLCTGSGCIAVSIAKLGAEYIARSALGDRKDGTADREKSLAENAPRTAVGGDPDAALRSVAKGDGQRIRVDASDVSPEALAVARENARRLGAQVFFIESDLFAEIGEYDMIVSNPPYIRTAVIAELSEEVRQHEPALALDGSEDGLHFYREITRQSPAHLKDGGWLLFEIGYDQAEAVGALMAESGFAEIEVVRDLAGHDRVVIGKWTGCR